MEQALSLAEQARGRTSPNPLVGAIIVDEEALGADGMPRVLGRGYHARPGGDHAEVAALRGLDMRAPGKTLYVTLEPCNHVGRTGRCTEAILAAGLRRVVVGLRDPNPRVSGGGIERLRQAGVEVSTGVLEARCRVQNRGYLRWLEGGRPHLLLKAAISIDGKLALSPPGGRLEKAPEWLTSSAARQRAHELRDHSDAILVGAGTVLDDDPLLTVRLPARRDERQPLRVVLDGALRTPPSARLCVPAPKTLIITSVAAIQKKPDQVAALTARGVELLSLPGSAEAPFTLDLSAVLRALGERDLLFVLCEGGAALHGALLSAGLYDEAALFMAPVFLGEHGRPLGLGLSPIELAQAPWLAETKMEALGPDFLLSGMLRSRGFSASEAAPKIEKVES